MAGLLAKRVVIADNDLEWLELVRTDLSLEGHDVVFAVCSDHGMQTIRRKVDIDARLVEAGFKASETSGDVVVAPQGTSAILHFSADAQHRVPAVLDWLGTQDFAGSGKIANNEKVTARIAARVVDVLPNRNLVIEGTRQIAFSGESQDAVLRGVIRAEDITANNTIFSYNIADATIRYISKGTVSDNQRKGWFTKIWEKVTPF